MEFLKIYARTRSDLKCNVASYGTKKFHGSPPGLKYFSRKADGFYHVEQNVQIFTI